MKKITFFVDNMYTVGGVEKVLSLIVNELSKNYEVEIVSLYKTSENPFFNIDSKVKLRNIFGSNRYNTKFCYLYLIYKVNKFFKDYNTDFFVATGMSMVSFSFYLSKKFKKYIAWEHNNSFAVGEGHIQKLRKEVGE